MAARSERDDLAHPTSPHPGARNRHRHCRPLPGPDQPRQPRRRAPAAEPRSRPRTRKQRLRTPLLPHDEARLPDHGQHQRDQNLCGPSRPSLPSSRRTRPGPYPGRSGSRPGHLGDAAAPPAGSSARTPARSRSPAPGAGRIPGHGGRATRDGPGHYGADAIPSSHPRKKAVRNHARRYGRAVALVFASAHC